MEVERLEEEAEDAPIRGVALVRNSEFTVSGPEIASQFKDALGRIQGYPECERWLESDASDFSKENPLFYSIKNSGSLIGIFSFRNPNGEDI